MSQNLSPIRLSILIPTLDEQAWIGHSVRCARASLRAAGLSGEVIVSDAGSTDATVERARRAGAKILVCERAARSAQINAAAAGATGDILVMLHADSLISPQGLFDMVASVDAGAVGGWFQIEILAEHGSFAGRHLLGWMARGINLRTRIFRTATADQCIFCRREVFERLGGLPDIALMEGNLFARTLRGQGDVAILGPELRISGRRWEQNGLLRTMLLMYGIRAAHRVGMSPERLAAIWTRFSSR